MEFESVDTAILAGLIAHDGRPTRVVDGRGNLIRKFG